jgi:hypothetical protein
MMLLMMSAGAENKAISFMVKYVSDVVFDVYLITAIVT